MCCKNRIFSWPSGCGFVCKHCCDMKFQNSLLLWKRGDFKVFDLKEKKEEQSLELSAVQNFATVIIHIINKQSKRSGVQGCGKRALWFSVSALPVNHFAELGKWLNLVGALCAALQWLSSTQGTSNKGVLEIDTRHEKMENPWRKMACKCNTVLSRFCPPRNPDVLDEKGVFAMYVWILVP